MLTEQELEQMRADQVALMADTVTVVRVNGSGWDEEAQQSVETWETIYTGPGRLAADPVPSVLGADGSIRQDQTFMLTVPHTVALEPGDRVTSATGTVVWVNQVQRTPFPATAARAHCTTTSQAGS